MTRTPFDERTDRLVATGQEFFRRLVELSNSCTNILDNRTDEAIELSPIEMLFCAAMHLVASCFHQPDAHEHVGFAHLSEKEAIAEFASLREHGVRMCFFPQVHIGQFRVDFLVLYLVGDAVKKIVVECDGYDFHERTKEQASADKRRDRVLQEMGCKVFRFSGSDIWRDAIGCAVQVWGSASKAITLAEHPDLEHCIAWSAPA